MVLEEPDIEIGQGVSSKAISRRMATDRGGQNGPRSGRDSDDRSPPSRFRKPTGKEEDRLNRWSGSAGNRGGDDEGPVRGNAHGGGGANGFPADFRQLMDLFPNGMPNMSGVPGMAGSPSGFPMQH
jgi:protein NRD1